MINCINYKVLGCVRYNKRVNNNVKIGKFEIYLENSMIIKISILYYTGQKLGECNTKCNRN